MPAVKIDDLNGLKGSNPSFMGSLNEGQQTVDKVKDIVNGINNILGKVQSFKQQANPQESKIPTPTPTIKAPSDMVVSTSKRAIIEVNEDKIIPSVKEFLGGINEEAKKQSLGEVLAQMEGNEQMIKALIIQLIKQNTSIKYID